MNEANSAYAAPVPVIGLAHGSRHPRGGEAIEALMAAVGELTGGPSRVAYLDLAEPDLDAVAAELAADGHRVAVVVPLLFTAAFHATVDVPEAVRAAADSTQLQLEVADILGTGDDIAELLDHTLTEAAGSDEPILLFAVGSSNPAANTAVADLAARLGRRRGVRAEAAFGTCAPRADAVLTSLGEPVTIVPLFLAEGLLLDPMRRRADEQGWRMTPPLAVRAAPLVVHRYDGARAAAGLG